MPTDAPIDGGEADAAAQRRQWWLVLLGEGEDRIERLDVREESGRWFVVGCTDPPREGRRTPRAAVLRYAVERGWPLVACAPEADETARRHRTVEGSWSKTLPTAEEVMVARESVPKLWLCAIAPGETRHFEATMTVAWRDVHGNAVTADWMQWFMREGQCRFTAAIGDDPFVVSGPDGVCARVGAYLNRRHRGEGGRDP